MLAIGYPDAGAFLRKATDFLERNETVNSLMLGVCLRLRSLGEGGQNAYAVVVDEGAITAAAVMTPPHNMLVAAANPESAGESVELIAKYLTYQGWKMPGVNGPKAASAQFARTWQSIDDPVPVKSARIARAMRLYDLETVTAPTVPGSLRPARESEIERLAGFMYGFQSEALGTPVPIHDVRDLIASRVHNGDVFVWADPTDIAVSMAMRSRPTRHMISIGAVYTPVESRGNGYASACVAALSQACLALGFQKSVLFTDLANPTSNSIYQRIGYRPVADFDEYAFEHRSNEPTGANKTDSGHDQ